MHCVQPAPFSKYRKRRQDKYQRRSQRLAQMRAAKERKRLANPVDREPKWERWFPLELGVRDKRSGEVAWVELRSVRDATRRISAVVKFYQPK